MASDVPKKVLWIFVFLILAAIAVLGVLFIRGYQTGKQITAIETSAQPQSTEEKPELTLTIDSPQADVATTSARLAITGTVTPGAFVAITGATEDSIIPASDGGNINTTVTLSEGLNVLTFAGFTEDGNTTQVKRNIVYTKGAL